MVIQITFHMQSETASVVIKKQHVVASTLNYYVEITGGLGPLWTCMLRVLNTTMIII